MANKRYWLGILAVALVFGMAVVGCDNGTTNIEYNKFTINGETYELIIGKMIHYGNHPFESAVNVDLVLYTEGGDPCIYFEMFVPNGNNRLVAGTYNLSQTLEDDDDLQFIYAQGNVQLPGETWYYVTGGTVTVSVSGSRNSAIYTIAIDCILVDEDDKDAGTSKGTFRGTLLWDDFEDDDEEEDNGVYSEFTIIGETYEIKNGTMYHFGNFFSESAVNVDLTLSTKDEDSWIYFEMFVPNGNNRLVEGTYSPEFPAPPDDDYPPFTYSSGSVVLSDTDTSYYVSGGTVEVSVSGSGNSAVYTIVIDCTLVVVVGESIYEDAGTLEGTYIGTLLWNDEV